MARIFAAVDDLVAIAEREHTVAVFNHGGVINALLHRGLRTERLMSFNVDYASVSGTEHEWDLLPRNLRW